LFFEIGPSNLVVVPSRYSFCILVLSLSTSVLSPAPVVLPEPALSLSPTSSRFSRSGGRQILMSRDIPSAFLSPPPSTSVSSLAPVVLQGLPLSLSPIITHRHAFRDGAIKSCCDVSRYSFCILVLSAFYLSLVPCSCGPPRAAVVVVAHHHALSRFSRWGHQILLWCPCHIPSAFSSSSPCALLSSPAPAVLPGPPLSLSHIITLFEIGLSNLVVVPTVVASLCLVFTNFMRSYI